MGVACKATHIPTVFTHILTQYLHTYFTRRTQGEHTTQDLHAYCTECYIQFIYTLHNTTTLVVGSYTTKFLAITVGDPITKNGYY